MTDAAKVNKDLLRINKSKQYNFLRSVLNDINALFKVINYYKQLFKQHPGIKLKLFPNYFHK